MKKLAVMMVLLGGTFGNVLGGWEQESALEGVSPFRGAIKGTVSAADATRLPGVLVSVTGTEVSTVTDDVGNYVLKELPPGTTLITISMEGFGERAIEVTVEAGKAATQDITLEVQELAYELTVTPEAPELMSASGTIGTVSVRPSQLATLPSLGEKDIFRTLQLMPGISATNEASSGLYVRGGTPDQNLVLLDGFAVYDVDHFFGVFSAFNANAIESVTMHKGGFESKYGGRLSSVVDMTGKSRRNDMPAFGGGFSFLSANSYVDIPVGKKGSFMLAGRRSYQSPFSDRIRDTYSDAGTTAGRGGGRGGFGGFTTQPESSFFDVNARATYAPTSKDNFLFSLYQGKDVLDNSRSLNITSRPFFNDTVAEEGEVFVPIEGTITNLSDWGNTGMSVGWLRNWTDSFFSRLTVAHSRYFKNYVRENNFNRVDETTDETEDPAVEEVNNRFSFAGGSSERNRLKDYTIRFENFFTLGSQHGLGFGAEVTRNRVSYDFNFRDDIAVLNQANEASQYAFYLQDTWMLFPRLSVTPGVRATYFDLSKKTYVDPRLSLVFHATDRLRLKAAGGRYHQFASRLTREDPLQGDQDFWMLADGDLVPVASGTHLIGGASYETDQFLFDVEAYRKNLSGLSEFASLRPRRGNFGNFDLTERFYSGTGRADGVEFLAQKKFGRNIGWMSYAVGSVEHLFPDIAPTPFAASHDATHEFKLVDSFKWKDWTLSGTWVYASGKPFTEPAGVQEITLANERVFEVIELGEKNAGRLPPYHRLDLAATWQFYKGETSQANAGVSIFNAYNQKNIWRKEYDIFEAELIESDVNYLGFTVSAFLNLDLSLIPAARKAGPAWSQASSAESQAKIPKAKKADKVYDFYGTVESMNSERLDLKSKWGQKSFLLSPATITGAPHYEPGTTVHVYYKRSGEQNIVTMVVRKIG